MAHTTLAPVTFWHSAVASSQGPSTDATLLEASLRSAADCSTSYASAPRRGGTVARHRPNDRDSLQCASSTVSWKGVGAARSHFDGSPSGVSQNAKRRPWSQGMRAVAGSEAPISEKEGADDSLLAAELKHAAERADVAVEPSNVALSKEGVPLVTCEGTDKGSSPDVNAEVKAAQGARMDAASESGLDKGGKHVSAAWEALKRWARVWQSLNKESHQDVLQRTKKIAVLGGGSFGTAMAVMLARNKADLDVVLLVRNAEAAELITKEHKNTRYFPVHRLPDNVRATTNAAEALSGAQFCIHAVPVQQSAAFLEKIAEHVAPTLPILSVSKGLEVTTLETMAELIPRALKNRNQPVAVLSGPSFSVELMDRKPTAIVAASKDAELARACQQLLASRYLRVNTTNDVVGVELAGALKNVLAIAAGIVDGMGLGNNCMAALVAQGCSEIRWLAMKMGAKATTLGGLAGTGDIMLTCFVSLSRNRSVGVRLGQGEKLEDIMSSMSQVAEGVATAEAVIMLARKYRVSMPVLTAVARILQNELTPKKAVLELMSLPQVAEV